MSIARDEFAYVRYYDDTLYSVNLETMECEETDYESDFGHFGMGFATTSANGWQDGLFVANRSQLARLNVANWTMENVGRLPSQWNSPATGSDSSGDPPARDPGTRRRARQGQRTHRALHQPGALQPYTIDTFAFANWGGDFFIFVRQNGMGESTKVLACRVEMGRCRSKPKTPT